MLDLEESTNPPRDGNVAHKVSEGPKFYLIDDPKAPSQSKTSLGSCVPTVGKVDVSLVELRQLIDDYGSMQRATIVRSRTFVEKRRFAPHRCLIVDLYRPGRKDLWLRLERKPTSAKDLQKGSGRTPSNDMVGVNGTHTTWYLTLNFSQGRSCGRFCQSIGRARIQTRQRPNLRRVPYAPWRPKAVSSSVPRSADPLSCLASKCRSNI